ncbi:MAG: response regulator [candidate division Zixibacteria bacterium]|nr:response regulator [candidate division Zixibacteria bacterium]
MQDNGPGISSSHFSKIFDPFFTTKKTGEGTGLGLSISYGIVKEHEGRLWVESPPNEGACFYVEIPVRMDETAAMRTAIEVALDADVIPQRVLVVDDEEEIAGYLHSALVRRGHHVDTANEGESAWRHIVNNRYDMILTDLKMPGMTGFWLFERIRR